MDASQVRLPDSLLQVDVSAEWRLRRGSFQGSLKSPEQLAAAARAGDAEQLRALLGRGFGAAVSAVCKDGQTALSAACAAGKAECAALLLASRAAVNSSCRAACGDGKTTPLHLAAELGHGKICMSLLAARADPHCPSSDGRTPAAYASNNEALWPIFDAAGCERIPQVRASESPPEDAECSTRPSSSTSRRGPGSVRPIDILAAESTSSIPSAASSSRLKSLGL
ncbi:unnamed protein product [Effrenium voratum]|nr:unnamed protein product [Effrenium voratum]